MRFSNLLQALANFIALGAGSGLSPIAPGTAGTLFAWLVFVLVGPKVWHYAHVEPWVFAAGVVVSFLISLWASERAAQAQAMPDPSSVVIDEIWAFWLILLAIYPASYLMQALAFGLFRLFDATKPGLIGKVERYWKGMGYRGAFGIMIDDVLAAIAALIVLLPLHYFFR